MALGTTVPAGAVTGVAEAPQLPSAQPPPQHELVGSQQKRLRNNRCRKLSCLPESQLEPQLQDMLLKARWWTGLTEHLSWQGSHVVQGQAGSQATGTLRQTLTQTSSQTQTGTFLQTVQGTLSHTV